MHVASVCQGSSETVHQRSPFKYDNFELGNIETCDKLAIAYIKRLCGTVSNLCQMLHGPFFALIEASLVITENVGEMDFEPSQSAHAEGPLIGKLEQTATQVITDVVEIRRDWVRPTAEV